MRDDNDQINLSFGDFTCLPIGFYDSDVTQREGRQRSFIKGSDAVISSSDAKIRRSSFRFARVASVSGPFDDKVVRLIDSRFTVSHRGKLPVVRCIIAR